MTDTTPLPSVPGLTDDQRDELARNIAHLAANAQAIIDAVMPALIAGMQAAAQQFAALQQHLQSLGLLDADGNPIRPTEQRCCVCGTTEHGGSAFYENYQGRLFCWPCADGDRPCDCHEPPIRQSQHVAPVPAPSAKDDGSISRHLKWISRARD